MLASPPKLVNSLATQVHQRRGEERVAFDRILGTSFILTRNCKGRWMI